MSLLTIFTSLLTELTEIIIFSNYTDNTLSIKSNEVRILS